ncbi:MAG: hypothetical protein L7V86_15390 [Verrucomicrobiales bacterium]|nr:hypothetical protein [Verrucomicrobiales bacterium]
MFALVFYYGGSVGVGLIAVLAAWTTYHSFHIHGRRRVEGEAPNFESLLDMGEGENLKSYWSRRRVSVTGLWGVREIKWDKLRRKEYLDRAESVNHLIHVNLHGDWQEFRVIDKDVNPIDRYVRFR